MRTLSRLPGDTGRRRAGDEAGHAALAGAAQLLHPARAALDEVAGIRVRVEDGAQADESVPATRDPPP